MSTRKILSIVGLSLSVLLLIFLFIPYFDLGEYEGTYSLWEYYDDRATICAVIILIDLLVAVAAYGLHLAGIIKDTQLAYLGLGYIFINNLCNFFSAMSNSAMDNLAFGFWLSLIVSVAAVVVTIIGSFVSDEPRPVNYYPQQPPQQPMGYNPNPGAPYYR